MFRRPRYGGGPYILENREVAAQDFLPFDGRVGGRGRDAGRPTSRGCARSLPVDVCQRQRLDEAENKPKAGDQHDVVSPESRCTKSLPPEQCQRGKTVLNDSGRLLEDGDEEDPRPEAEAMIGGRKDAAIPNAFDVDYVRVEVALALTGKAAKADDILFVEHGLELYDDSCVIRAVRQHNFCKVCSEPLPGAERARWCTDNDAGIINRCVACGVLPRNAIETTEQEFLPGDVIVGFNGAKVLCRQQLDAWLEDAVAKVPPGARSRGQLLFGKLVLCCSCVLAIQFVFESVVPQL